MSEHLHTPLSHILFNLQLFAPCLPTKAAPAAPHTVSLHTFVHCAVTRATSRENTPFILLISRRDNFPRQHTRIVLFPIPPTLMTLTSVLTVTERVHVTWIAPARNALTMRTPLVPILPRYHAILAFTQPLAVARILQIRLVFKAYPADPHAAPLRHHNAVDVVLVLPARKTLARVLALAAALAWKPLARPAPCKTTPALFFHLVPVARPVVAHTESHQRHTYPAFDAETHFVRFFPRAHLHWRVFCWCSHWALYCACCLKKTLYTCVYCLLDKIYVGKYMCCVDILLLVFVLFSLEIFACGANARRAAKFRLTAPSLLDVCFAQWGAYAFYSYVCCPSGCVCSRLMRVLSSGVCTLSESTWFFLYV